MELWGGGGGGGREGSPGLHDVVPSVYNIYITCDPWS